VVALAAASSLLAAVAVATPASAQWGHNAEPGQPDFGPNVTIFTPDMDQADIQATVDDLADQMRDAEMTTDRHAVYFMPGTYGTDDNPLHVEVGYYTEVSGLGASPDDVTINGSVDVYNRCLEDDGTSNCLALVNFWRTLSNLAIHVNVADREGCRAAANFWAVSQAVSMRRIDMSGGGLTLMDYCTAGPQFASGGYIADSRLPDTTNGSQQQWLTRNSEVASWSNAVWNQVFSGVEGAPDDAAFPDPPYTTVDETPVSREKPYLFVDSKGRYNVRVPSAQTDTRGVSWDEGLTAGRTEPISNFYIAQPGVSVKTINRELARGKNLLFTPGVYDIGSSINVKRKNTVVLGMGHATLTAVNGATPIKVSDVPGVVIAGISIDAGSTESPVLLQVGKEDKSNGHSKGKGSPKKADASNPITLSDVYFRVGGPHIGKADIALEVNADNTLIDHTWVWRGDHGVEGFTEGVNGDTDRWNTNIGRNGVVINGDNVTATGLFVEHFQEYNTIWNGENGTTILYQNELPYDPPTQADWNQPDGTLGWSGYKVADDVKNHELFGAGVYVFNQNNPDIATANGFEVPQTPGVQLHHIMTVNLSAGTVEHVVNGVGGAATMDNVGSPQFVTDYPTP